MRSILLLPYDVTPVGSALVTSTIDDFALLTVVLTVLTVLLTVADC